MWFLPVSHRFCLMTVSLQLWSTKPDQDSPFGVVTAGDAARWRWAQEPMAVSCREEVGRRGGAGGSGGWIESLVLVRTTVSPPLHLSPSPLQLSSRLTTVRALLISSFHYYKGTLPTVRRNDRERPAGGLNSCCHQVRPPTVRRNDAGQYHHVPQPSAPTCHADTGTA
jgi:hypothetical protein